MLTQKFACNSTCTVRTSLSINTLLSSLEEESSESVCGPQLTEKNTRLSGALPHLVWAFSTVDNYLTVIVTGTVLYFDIM